MIAPATAIGSEAYGCCHSDISEQRFPGRVQVFARRCGWTRAQHPGYHSSITCFGAAAQAAREPFRGGAGGG